VAGLLELSWDEIHGIMERVKRGLERRQGQPVSQPRDSRGQPALDGGRDRTRTCDLLRVKQRGGVLRAIEGT
jgi:hypothetical protein